MSDIQNLAEFDVILNSEHANISEIENKIKPMLESSEYVKESMIKSMVLKSMMHFKHDITFSYTLLCIANDIRQLLPMQSRGFQMILPVDIIEDDEVYKYFYKYEDYYKIIHLFIDALLLIPSETTSQISSLFLSFFLSTNIYNVSNIEITQQWFTSCQLLVKRISSNVEVVNESINWYDVKLLTESWIIDEKSYGDDQSVNKLPIDTYNFDPRYSVILWIEISLKLFNKAEHDRPKFPNATKTIVHFILLPAFFIKQSSMNFHYFEDFLNFWRNIALFLIHHLSEIELNELKNVILISLDRTENKQAIKIINEFMYTLTHYLSKLDNVSERIVGDFNTLFYIITDLSRISLKKLSIAIKTELDDNNMLYYDMFPIFEKNYALIVQCIKSFGLKKSGKKDLFELPLQSMITLFKMHPILNEEVDESLDESFWKITDSILLLISESLESMMEKLDLGIKPKQSRRQFIKAQLPHLSCVEQFLVNLLTCIEKIIQKNPQFVEDVFIKFLKPLMLSIWNRPICLLDRVTTFSFVLTWNKVNEHVDLDIVKDDEFGKLLVKLKVSHNSLNFPSNSSFDETKPDKNTDGATSLKRKLSISPDNKNKKRKNSDDSGNEDMIKNVDHETDAPVSKEVLTFLSESPELIIEKLDVISVDSSDDNELDDDAIAIGQLNDDGKTDQLDDDESITVRLNDDAVAIGPLNGDRKTDQLDDDESIIDRLYDDAIPIGPLNDDGEKDQLNDDESITVRLNDDAVAICPLNDDGKKDQLNDNESITVRLNDDAVAIGPLIDGEKTDQLDDNESITDKLDEDGLEDNNEITAARIKDDDEMTAARLEENDGIATAPLDDDDELNDYELLSNRLYDDEFENSNYEAICARASYICNVKYGTVFQDIEPMNDGSLFTTEARINQPEPEVTSSSNNIDRTRSQTMRNQSMAEVDSLSILQLGSPLSLRSRKMVKMVIHPFGKEKATIQPVASPVLTEKKSDRGGIIRSDDSIKKTKRVSFSNFVKCKELHKDTSITEEKCNIWYEVNNALNQFHTNYSSVIPVLEQYQLYKHAPRSNSNTLTIDDSETDDETSESKNFPTSSFSYPRSKSVSKNNNHDTDCDKNLDGSSDVKEDLSLDFIHKLKKSTYQSSPLVSNTSKANVISKNLTYDSPPKKIRKRHLPQDLLDLDKETYMIHSPTRSNIVCSDQSTSQNIGKNFNIENISPIKSNDRPANVTDSFNNENENKENVTVVAQSDNLIPENLFYTQMKKKLDDMINTLDMNNTDFTGEEKAMLRQKAVRVLMRLN